jgi:hypothetical protein
MRLRIGATVSSSVLGSLTAAMRVSAVNLFRGIAVSSSIPFLSRKY